MKKKYKILFLFCFAVLLTAPVLTFASELRYPPIFGLTPNDTWTFPEYARYFFSFGIAISTALAALVIIFGGIYHLVDLGRGKFASEGKEWVKAGITGLLIIFCSYLIVYTINPDLAIFRLSGLKPVIVANPMPDVFRFNAPRVFYTEIPIGILTEQTLSKSIDCYDFDFHGDPIPAALNTDNTGTVGGPTFLNHDRADCIAKLTDAAAKKAGAIKKLSDEIAKLMKQCKCENSDENGKPICNQTCSEESPCDSSNDYSGKCETDEESSKKADDPCSGNCLKQPCKFSKDTKAKDCCPEGVKEVIEHGPVALGAPEGCTGEDNKKYHGLDEFRCPNPIRGAATSQCSGIANSVEETVRANDQDIKVINPDKWNSLNLIQQLSYFKEKIDEIKSKIKNDADELVNAESALSKCYLVVSYFDFWKTFEKTRPEEKVILKKQIYTDSETGKKIDISKYCNGFSYGNSSCFNICQNLCPGNPQEDLACYKQVSACVYDNFSSDSDYYDCLAEQAVEMDKCYAKRKCQDNSGGYTNFAGCLAFCRGKCSQDCLFKYPMCSEEYANCIDLCEQNSKCLQENISNCVFNSSGLKNCADKIGNAYYLKYCVDNSYSCKYGSWQNAGYPECLKKPYSTRQNYSASYIFQHWNYQQCPEPYQDFDPDSVSGSVCLDIYPETEKCPSASNCPDCPCGEVADTNNVVEGQCNEFLYNDDPLTFYCPENWWLPDKETEQKNEKPLGIEYDCPERNEIPVGRAVDGAEKWADDLVEKLEDVLKKIKEMADYVKKIGNENPESYCKCDSVCEQGRPCQTDCKYQEITTKDEEGNETTNCQCAFQPCQGISCQKMINLLNGGKTDNCPVEKEGVESFYDKINEASKSLYKFLVIESRSDILKQLTYSRTATNECSQIGNVYDENLSKFGRQTEFLSCLRAEENIVSSIKAGQVIINGKIYDSFCYGCKIGEILKETGKISDSLMDNWFCCEKR